MRFGLRFVKFVGALVHRRAYAGVGTTSDGAPGANGGSLVARTASSSSSNVGRSVEKTTLRPNSTAIVGEYPLIDASSTDLTHSKRFSLSCDFASSRLASGPTKP